MSKTKTVVSCAVRPELKRKIQEIAEDMGSPYTASFIAARLIEIGLEQYVKGEVEL